jgi:hypothetical protein
MYISIWLDATRYILKFHCDFLLGLFVNEVLSRLIGHNTDIYIFENGDNYIKMSFIPALL